MKTALREQTLGRVQDSVASRSRPLCRPALACRGLASPGSSSRHGFCGAVLAVIAAVRTARFWPSLPRTATTVEIQRAFN